MKNSAGTAAVKRWADISEDKLYRFVLGRSWDESLPECVFIMLNPSTADESHDDPTIRRCINFAKSFGCGTLLVGNLYAFRTNDPRDLFRSSEPTGGVRNDAALTDLLPRGSVVIAAWGAHAKVERVTEVLRLPGFDRLTALATTKAGMPRHPLYVPATATPQAWTMSA